ncbi:hypothetical protein EET67_07050 [Pseudaminobacter arsenicus]|uniref:Co-chaperone DjlA N-terminal domain-containing protein n=1 Tax=Borborobacter arsenicus TaxID=1851146 RepID=A0A432V8V5_9HYPH|nr:TerB family tellurite resistance protein [Pseudaminobacter arsenicus]RUM98608.1 hypothetical protein EET67_07050 [Pseudaminobacter arsenicus]
MLQRVLSFLRDLPNSAADTRFGADDPRVAAAALMYHVINADGIRHDVEWERLKELFSQAYDTTGEELKGLLDAGEQAHQEAIDLYAFTSVLNRHLDEAGRIEFIRLLWDLCYADGELHELEDNTLWRVAELIRVERRDRITARQQAAKRVPGATGGSSDSSDE